MTATLAIPGLLLLLIGGASPAGIVPGAVFVMINGAIILNGMT